jgi:hypothetical protein
MDRIYLAQDRDSSQALMNMAMIYRVSINERKPYSMDFLYNPAPWSYLLIKQD